MKALMNSPDDQLSLFAISVTSAICHWEYDPSADYGDILYLLHLVNAIYPDLPMAVRHVIYRSLKAVEDRL